MNKQTRQPAESPGRQRVTLRDIAGELKISHVTVSKALRDLPGVSDSLKARIRAKADEMGYVPDPLLSALSNYRKTDQAGTVHSALAWLNPWERPEELHAHREFELYREGAANSAHRLGYQLENFNLADIPARRLQTILRTRNIQGILLPPIHGSNDWIHAFDWSGFSVVRFGQAVAAPRTHRVTSAQAENTILAFDRTRQLGYQRIGFVCEYWRTRYFGTGFTWAQKQLPPEQQLPLLALNPEDDFPAQQHDVDQWIQQYRPDAILTDNSETHQMLINLNYRIPDDMGLATTSIHDTSIDAGIDQRPYEIGRAAIRMLTALIAEKSRGIPECRNETLIEGRWVDGSMLPLK